MRKFEYRFHFALTLVGFLLNGQGAACEPPPGFINPPRPDIAPLEELLAHTEEKDIAQPLAVVTQAASRTLRIDATKDLPGVSGTFRLSNGPYGSVGARRLVCKTDGSTSVEEVLLTESNGDGSRFRYVVWNYTSTKYRDVEYAVGEFVRTQPAPDKTHVRWTYRFALKTGLSSEERSRFQKVFLERELSVWMRTQLDRGQSSAEAKPVLSGQSLACEPPDGFVNPPRPDIAPLEKLMSHTERMDIARGLAVVMKTANRPLQEVIRPTKELPGVRGTFNLAGRFGTPGSRRLVCLTDGSMAVEEALYSEVNPDNRRFRYVVWNYTSEKFRTVEYAVGEFVYTQPAPDKTHINWTYRFALKSGLGSDEESRFQMSFLEGDFAEWMRGVLELKRTTAEAAP